MFGTRGFLVWAAVGSLLAAQGVVAPGAAVREVAKGFRFTEGPASDGRGGVYFSDIPNARIHHLGPDGTVRVVREDSGGANGLWVTPDGRLLACEGVARRVTARSKNGGVTTLAATHDGEPLNSPNDLWVDGDGGIWFTDPRYGDQSGLKQGGFHVYYLAPGTEEPVRVIDDLVKPNGLIGTRDGKTLYVADPGDRKTYVYRIEGPGRLGEKRLFAETGSDGLTLDEHGNLYVTAASVLVFSPDGRLRQQIRVPQRPSNVTFGGPDGRTLFITARTSVYALAMAVRGG
jgi:gluconolactonase